MRQGADGGDFLDRVHNAASSLHSRKQANSVTIAAQLGNKGRMSVAGTKAAEDDEGTSGLAAEVKEVKEGMHGMREELKALSDGMARLAAAVEAMGVGAPAPTWHDGA